MPHQGASSLCNSPPKYRSHFPTCASLVYRASQFEADAQIGRLMHFIRGNSTLDGRTLVVISTDNGPEDPHIYMNSKGDPGPYRGSKRRINVE